jgi:hypothetical protein
MGIHSPAFGWTSYYRLLLITLISAGCADRTGPPSRSQPHPTPNVSLEKLEIFRRAETQRAEALSREIERLQTDLRKAEAALVEAESGLAGDHTRADAVSKLAVVRIQVERAAARAPWRTAVMNDARAKLAEAERQVIEGRFGAALFFVYRAQRMAEGVSDEVDSVLERGNARVIHAGRVNLRAGPSTHEPILAVLETGTPVIPRTWNGEWTLVQVSGGPSGWIHGSLIGDAMSRRTTSPASPRP